MELKSVKVSEDCRCGCVIVKVLLKNDTEEIIYCGRNREFALKMINYWNKFIEKGDNNDEKVSC